MDGLDPKTILDFAVLYEVIKKINHQYKINNSNYMLMLIIGVLCFVILILAVIIYFFYTNVYKYIGNEKDINNKINECKIIKKNKKIRELINNKKPVSLPTKKNNYTIESTTNYASESKNNNYLLLDPSDHF